MSRKKSITTLHSREVGERRQKGPAVGMPPGPSSSRLAILVRSARVYRIFRSRNLSVGPVVAV